VSKPIKALLTCPRCGNQQMESRAAFSAVCRKCGEYLRVQELLKPAPKAAAPPPERKRITCFDCGAESDVPASAQSTMCKKCSSYIDLHDYSITSAVSKNFKTKGSFVIQPTGYVFNSETIAREASIKGRFIGKLVVEETLTLFSTAQIKGEFTAQRLVVPASNQFRWSGAIKAGSFEIEGELVATVAAEDSVHVKPHGRLVGDVTARSLVADTGAILEVRARISPKAAG
jgi:cytoskeletal protein CcmA (bactofilin family)/ribosomal protein S27E